MIVSFADRDAERLFLRQRVKRLDSRLHKKALTKLLLLDAAHELDELRVPPGNRLEALKGDRIGQHSIRINDQWRLCFRFDSGNAYDVQIADYH